jgi:DNA-binding MarR family transcriptional regulator
MASNTDTTDELQNYSVGYAPEALLRVLRTAAALDHAVGEALKPYRLTYTQYSVLRTLASAGAAGLCGRQIGERLVSPVPDMPRLLERMAESGLIRRMRDPYDRRHVTAQITEDGELLLRVVDPVLAALAAQRFQHLDAQQQRMLVDLLDRVRHACYSSL